MTNTRTAKTRRMVGISILTALVVVLSLLSLVVKVGPFNITMTLVPIVIGAALYGTRASAWLGGVFGFVVVITCVTNVDAGGGILWNVNPILTFLVCMVKGIAAGTCAGLVYGAVSKKSVSGGVLSAAIVSPVVNTGLFLAALIFLFESTLVEWAGAAGKDVVTYILTVLVGINFIIELVLNLVLSSVIVRLIKYRHKGVM